MPSTRSRMGVPPNCCSTARREFRRPCAAGLQVCSSPCAHGPLVHTRRSATRAACTPFHALWARVAPHGMSRSMQPLTVSSTAESRRLPLRCEDRCRRCAAASIDGALLMSINCGPFTALEPMVELDSRVCKRRIRRPLHTTALMLRVALSVASCARALQVHCFS